MRIELTNEDVGLAIRDYALRKLGCVGKFQCSTEVIGDVATQKFSAFVTIENADPVPTMTKPQDPNAG